MEGAETANLCVNATRDSNLLKDNRHIEQTSLLLTRFDLLNCIPIEIIICKLVFCKSRLVGWKYRLFACLQLNLTGYFYLNLPELTELTGTLERFYVVSKNLGCILV